MTRTHTHFFSWWFYLQMCCRWVLADRFCSIFYQHLHANLISRSTSAGNDFSVQAVWCGVDKEGGRWAVSDHSWSLGGGRREGGMGWNETRSDGRKAVVKVDMSGRCLLGSIKEIQQDCLNSRGQCKHSVGHLPVHFLMSVCLLDISLRHQVQSHLSMYSVSYSSLPDTRQKQQ